MHVFNLILMNSLYMNSLCYDLILKFECNVIYIQNDQKVQNNVFKELPD